MELNPQDIAALGTVIAQMLAKGLCEEELLALKLLVNQVSHTLGTISTANLLENKKNKKF